MRQVTFTATLAYNAYDESRDYPSRVHIIRGLSATHRVRARPSGRMARGSIRSVERDLDISLGFK
jgi:hypothetical protein